MINIIGGAGFVGSKLADVLQKSGRPYRVFDKILSGDQYVDVTKPDTVLALPTADVVINLAAEHKDNVTPPSLYDLVNVDGARHVCNYCKAKNINKIVFTSSVAVYGFAPPGTDEKGALKPFNDYGRSKMEAEEVYRQWLAEDPNGRSLVIIRPAVIFGEGNRGNVYNLLNQIAKGHFVMIGPGLNYKSMAYVDNVAEFIAYSTSFDTGLRTFNYADAPDLSMNELVSFCRDVIRGKNNIGLRLPSWAGIFIGYCFDGLAKITSTNFSISSVRVRKFLATSSFTTSVKNSGFVPTWSLKTGLKRTLEYDFKDAKKKK